jgi:hypothetical protein
MPDPFRSTSAPARIASETSDDWLTSFVMTNTVETIGAWIGPWPKRAARVAAIEAQRPKPRAQLLKGTDGAPA